MKIPESDWKKLRGIREELLRRLCAGILLDLNPTFPLILRKSLICNKTTSFFGHYTLRPMT